MSVCRTERNENKHQFRLRWNETRTFQSCVYVSSALKLMKTLPFIQIWVRNYQIVEQAPNTALEASQAKKESGMAQATSLVEIGPRFVLNPIRIFRGSFHGQTLFQNPDFVSPNAIRAMERRQKGMSYEERKNAQLNRQERRSQIVVPEDPLGDVFR